MLRHHLIAAIRGFTHHKLYGFINIAGLSIGLACAILIVLYVRDQLSYDAWIPGTSHLYRLERADQVPGHGLLHGAQCPFPVLTAVGEEIPQVRAVTHVVPEFMTVRAGGRSFHERVILVDPNFLQQIRLPLVRGDAAHALSQPESVVLSQSMARKLFGASDPMGRVVAVIQDHNDTCSAADTACLEASHPLTVTGVLRDLPHNTQLVADFVIPNTSRADGLSHHEKISDWLASDGAYGYVQLAPGASPDAVSAAIGPILDRSIDFRKHGMTQPVSRVERYFLTPFRDAHLTTDANGGMTPPGSWAVVYGLSAIALLIVLIACCNFMNLATARASLRAREIALRKLGGAKRRQLVAQFLGEAMLAAFVALAIALSLVEVVLPAYGRFLGEPISVRYLADWRLFAALIAGTAAVGLLSGLYPAFVISGLRPLEGLRPGATNAGGPGLLRSLLVVVQFAISIGLAVAGLVVLRQTDFARHVDLGINRDGVVVVQGIARMTASQRDSLAERLKSGPGIESIAYSRGAPFGLYGFFTSLQIPGGQPVQAELLNISPEFPSLYGMRLLAGRLLSADRGDDASTFSSPGDLLINETAARRLGLSAEEAIGKTIEPLGSRAKVVGVLSDANLRGVRDAVEPMVFWFDKSDRGGVMTDLSVLVRMDRLQEALSFIDRTWRTLEPAVPIQRHFVADAFNDFFRADDRQGAMLGVFVGIAILIACLGLFGLTVFTAERRTKEVGVRKISGARTGDIVRLMLWRISVPVLAANLIAWPGAYYYLQRWLAGYAYRVPLSPIYFLEAGAVALAIAWATVYGHTLRLARTSPIRALRCE
jgi:putative ABC transport system permease protein